MNPALPASVVEQAMAKDPQRAGAEFESRWREDLSDFIPADIIERATDFDVFQRPPQAGVSYAAFADAAGGTGKDSFTLGVSHRDRDGRAVLDVLREWRPRFIPKEVVKECASILRAYRVKRVVSDRFASSWAADEWERNHIRHEPSELTKTQIYQSVLPALMSGQVRLLDSERMRRQFASLQRRTFSSGRETIDDSGGASANDDLSNAASGAVVLALSAAVPIGALFTNEMIAGLRAAGPALGRGQYAPQTRFPNLAQADDDTRPPRSWNPTPVAQFERWQRK
jgi:hypothetical protein